MKKQLEELGADWAAYWTKQGREDRIEDFGEFKDCDSLFRAIHDIGGVRVLLYSPGDIKRVVEAIQKEVHTKPGLTIDRIVQRGLGTAPDMHQLNSYIEILQGKLAESWAPSEENNRGAIMAGYRATHVIVAFGDKKHPAVEIQITTLVMNAWSEIEHGIVYKANNGDPSSAELGILKTFNNAVAVGESALRQLEDVQREANETAANTIYDIGKWITLHAGELFDGKQKAGKLKNMEHLHVLFEVLSCRSSATSSRIKRLVDSLREEAGGLRDERDRERFEQHELPIHLLWQLHKIDKDEARPFYRKPQPQPKLDMERYEREMAYRPALETVWVLNLANYLGVKEHFIQIMDRRLKQLKLSQITKPTMANFLGLLHPSKGKMHSSMRSRIFQFCKAFLDTKQFESAAADYFKVNDSSLSTYEHHLLLLPFKLVEGGFAVDMKPETSQENSGRDPVLLTPEAIYIQREFCRWLSDPQSTHWIPDIIACASQLETRKSVYPGPPKHPMTPNNIPRRLNVKGDRDAEKDRGAPENDVGSLEMEGKIWFKRRQHTVTMEWPVRERVPFELHDDPSKIGRHLHLDKGAHRPLEHPGFFASATSTAGAPAWLYCAGPPNSNWEVQDAKWNSCKVEWCENIEDELHEMASYLNIEGSFGIDEKKMKEVNPPKTTTYYKIRIDGFDYILKSSTAEFVLSMDLRAGHVESPELEGRVKPRNAEDMSEETGLSASGQSHDQSINHEGRSGSQAQPSTNLDGSSSPGPLGPPPPSHVNGSGTYSTVRPESAPDSGNGLDPSS
ncbi:hypothetical protein F5X68DRAFT_250870 [Plectosphaerella plurivora]|uniref:RelA/SpoT domain-containing protein n=1 Tax=Plectosphaerella plurivora TaxID=936078 RepID=A0A9P9AG33_9PEZI|nr:hypothetical protein F5X68DRAFT_250870 [Plectosphaerella plurivora]